MTEAVQKKTVLSAGPIRLHAHFYVAGILLLLASIGFNFWLDRLNRLKSANLSVPLKQPLSSIPAQLGDWVMVEEIELPQNVKDIAGVDDYVNRRYVQKGQEVTENVGEHKAGTEEGLHVYVAYFGGIRTAAPHRPDICLRGSGWTIAGAHRRQIEIPGMGETQTVGVHVDVFTREENRQMVVWWEYIHGKNVTNPLMERVRWILPLFMGGKAGSVVQVQISQDVGAKESEDEVYERIVGFARAIAPEVGKCLPETE